MSSDPFVLARGARPGTVQARIIGKCYKRPYHSKAKANKQMKTWGRRHGCKNIYYCNRCDAWHLTKMVPPKRAEKC